MQFNKGKKLATRALSAGLASLMLFTSVPLDVQASAAAIAGAAGAAAGSGAIGDNTEGSVSTGVANTYKGSGWVDTRQGYRFYIVDTNCTRQSDIYDFVFEQPTGVPNDKWYTNTRWEAPSTGNYDNYYLYSINSLANEWCAGAVNAQAITGIPPLLILKCVNGGEFQEWFIGKHGGGAGGGGSSNISTMRPTQNGSLNGIVGGASTVNLAGGDYQTYFNAVETVQCELMWGDGGFGISTNARLKYIEEIGSNYISSYFANKAASYATEMKQVYNDVYSSISSLEGTNFKGTDRKLGSIDLQAYAYYQAYEQVMGSWWMSNTEYSRAMQAATQYFFDGGDLSAMLDKGTKSGGVKPTTNGTVNSMLDASNTISLNQPIPLSAMEYPADIMLKRSEFRVYGFSEDVDGDGMVTAMDALKYKDEAGNYMYYLIVEPLAWINIYTSKTSYEPTRTYGTYYNLVEYLYGLGTNDAASGAHYSYFQQYGKNSLQVNKSYPEMARPIFAKETDAKMTVSQVYAAMKNNIGYGMHVYCAGDFENGTSTFDEPLGDNPGPAPDDSKDLTDTEKSNPRQYANIVKFYESYVDGNLDTNDSFNREVTPKIIQIEDEISYKVVDWFTSPTYRPAGGSGPRYDSYKGGLSSTQSGQTPTSVELQNETTLYVLLVKEDENPDIEQQEGDWILSESRLTKIAKTTNTDDGRDVSSTVVFKITYPGLDEEHGDCYCPEGGWHSDVDPETGKDNGHSCGGCADVDRSLGNNDAEIIWKNKVKHTYSKLMSTMENETWGEKWNKHYKGTRDGIKEEKDELTGVTYDFLIHRAGYDKTMIFTGKNALSTATNIVEPNLLTLQFTQGKSGSPKRTNASKKYAIGLNFSDDDAKSDNLTTSVCDRCGDVYEDNNTTITELDISGHVVINTYAGISSSTRNNTECDVSEVMYIGTSSYNRSSGRMVYEGKTFRFIPYIQMQYDNLSTQNIKTLVTGQFERAMTVNDYAEVAWNTAEVGNLHVTSNQWSTHAGALALSQKLLNSAVPNIMLPGGALYSLDTKNSEQEVQISTYQTVLIGNGLEQAKEINQDLSKLQVSAAKAAHQEFVQSVIDGLTAVPVKQYVDKDTGSRSALDGIHVYPGANISSLGNGSSKASTASKYYFVDDPSGTGNGANENDLDAWITNEGAPKFWTFYSDVKGNIHMAETTESGSPISDTVILTKNQGISSLSNPKAVAINNRTFIVKKLVEAIERNTGNDTDADWVSDGHWYNEAFNGVTVMEWNTKINVGFYDPSLRTTVLDPKLIPKQETKGTVFTNAFISQFETSDKSLNYGKTNVVGTFKGNEIQMRDLKFLFQSNTFYIPDVNVQDLS